MLAVDLRPGMFVGEFELLERAGAGGFSEVWKVRKPPEPALYAIKLPRVDALVDHLRRDAALASRFSDPQVVAPLEVRLDAEPPHVVLPWIEGRPFPLPETPPRPEEQAGALALFLELVRVVARLHEQGLVHGDLKPGNVLVDASGSPRILDLGLARVQIEARLERSLAQSVVSVDGRSIAGTLDFMAPELFDGAKPSSASDVYSLGVILHHLLSGRPPAFGVSPRALNPYLPPGCEDFLRRLLHFDPASRVARAADLVPELERLHAAELRCLARRHGHERRRVFLERMGTLKRGLRALGVGLSAFSLASGAIVLLGELEASQTFRGPALEAALVLIAISGFSFFTIVPLLLAVTTVNAWVLGIPEKTYKNRRGHPIWSFLMQ
jgi:serine/threonine protein kinase